VLEAVLFDWGHTLMDWVPDDALLEAGHRAGLEAIGVPADRAPALTDRYRNEPSLFDWDVPEELEYPPLLRRMLADVGVDVDDGQLEQFMLAEHAAWAPARRLAGTTHALLDSIRNRGLKTGIVSNSFDPGWILTRDLQEIGLAQRVDVAVFSSDLGIRKPSPEIFLRALDELGVAPDRALFVGDRLRQDVGGAHGVGMRTVQAMWYRAEESSDDEIEPDFRAFTQFDVLNIVRRLTGELQ
jgi:putative hydrolase of the HAD superfamily